MVETAISKEVLIFLCRVNLTFAFGRHASTIHDVHTARYLLAGAAVKRIRGRVHALHLVKNHALVRQGLVLVFQLVVPPFLLHHLGCARRTKRTK